MADFSWMTAGLIFVTYVIIDVLYALYVQSVAKQRPIPAALFGSAIYSLGAYGVVTYSHNMWYLIPLASGAFLGTYLVVKYKKD
jgi:hypothetical protein